MHTLMKTGFLVCILLAAIVTQCRAETNGEPEHGCMIDVAVSKGTRAAVGFSDDINRLYSFTYNVYFWEALCKGQRTGLLPETIDCQPVDVQSACTYALNKVNEIYGDPPNTGLESYRIAGNKTQKVVPFD